MRYGAAGGSTYAGADRSTQRPDKYPRPNAQSEYFGRWAGALGTFVACIASLDSDTQIEQAFEPVFRARTLCTSPTTTRWSRQSMTLRILSSAVYRYRGGSGAREPVFPRARPCIQRKTPNDILAKQVEIREQYKDEMKRH